MCVIEISYSLSYILTCFAMEWENINELNNNKGDLKILVSI